MKIRKFLFVAIVICHVFCSCSSSTDTVIEDNVDKEQAHFEGVFNANSVIVHPGTNNWYGIDISRANTFWSNPDVGDALTGFANGLNAGMAGYSTSYVSTPYGGYTVSTYNPGNAAVANMIATNQMMEMGKQMENDRRIRDEGYLKKNTIHPGEGIVGYMFVKKQKGVTMEVQIPVNGVVFDYKWNILGL